MKATRATKVVGVLLLLLSVGSFRLQAQTAVSWTGTTGNWNLGSNWSGGVVPNNGGGKTYNVTVGSGAAAETITLNLNATVSDLTLGTTSGNDVTLQSTAGDSLTLASGGSLTIASSGTLLFDTAGSDITIGSGGTLTNNGTLDLEAAGETLKVTGMTTNASGATVNIEGGNAATFSGNVNNSGTFETGFSGGGNTVAVSGTFTNASGATLELEGTGDAMTVTTLSNSGTLTLDAGSTLTITGGGNGVTDVAAGTTYNIGGTFNVKNGSTTTSALAKLNSVEGTINFTNGVSNTITPASGTLTVASGGELSVDPGSSTNTTLSITGNVSNSGTFETGFNAGGNTVNVSGTFTNNAGATLQLYGSGDILNVGALSNSGTLQIDSGATLNITGGGQGVTDILAGSTLTLNGTLNVVNSGKSTNGLANLTTVAGTLDVSNGQTTTVKPTGGTLTIAASGVLEISDGAASNTTLAITGNVNNSGTFTTGFAGGTNTVNVSGTFTNAAGGDMILYSPTDMVNVNAFSNSGSLEIGTSPGSGATLTITGGGKGITDVLAGSSIELFGTLDLKNGSTTTSALANLTTVQGALDLENNQITAVTPTGGTLTIASTGEVELSGNAPSTTTLSITGNVNNSGAFNTGFAGGTNAVTVSGTFTNKSGATLTIYGGGGSGAGTDLVNVATLSNAGTVLLEGTGSTLDITGTGTLTNSGSFNLLQGILKFNSSTAILTGGGTLTLGDVAGSETGEIEVGSSDTGTLTNSSGTITGYGNLGNGTLTLINRGTVSANGQVSSGALTVQPGSAGMTNSGTLEAINQATLVLNGTFNNTGGTIEALSETNGAANSTVQLAAGTVINGGTLTTTTAGSNSGVIENTGAVTLNGVTNTGTYTDTTGTTTTLKGTIANSGSITLTASTLSLGNSVTLNGVGTVVLSNSASNVITAATAGLTLTNANTIEGSGTIQKMGIVNTGTISADQSTILNILPSAAGLNNSGTLSVSTGDTMKIGTSTGGALLNFSGTTLTGGTYTVSGTLEFGASGTNVVTDAANITLTGANAKIIDFASVNVLANLATVTSVGSFTIGSGANFTTAGNFSNLGKLAVNAGSTFIVTGSLSNFNSSTNTLTGGSYTVGGTLEFAGANIVTDAASITLSDTGKIVNSTTSGNGLANLATITSAGSLTLAAKAAFTTADNLTNNGKLVIDAGSTLTVAGNLTNFNSTTDTLTNGTYTVGGTLEFTGANIVNNAANLTISGSSAKILNGTANGLASFTNNTGSLTVTGDGSFTTGSANFTNSGNVTVTKGSTLSVGGGNAYNQSAGTTTVDGALVGFGIDVTGGTIEGAGKLSQNVTVGGSGTAPTLNVGDSGKAGLLIITGSYTQLSTATMKSFIGGTTVGTQYSQLQVSGTATLAGTLTVALASGFTPTVGSTFTVLTASSISGAFSNSTIAINSTEHFNVSYTSTGVVLTVASGAASQSGGELQSTLVTSVPRKQPILSSGPRHWIGAAPSGNNHLYLAGMGDARPQSGAMLASSELRRYERGNGLELAHIATPEVVTWEHKLPVVPVTRLQLGLERGRQIALHTTPYAAPNTNDWTEPIRGVSPLRMPANGALIQRMPVRILSPMLPRLQR
jgi:fibronectin-binding autotransporter adhesin